MLTGGRRACGGRGAVVDGEDDSVVLGVGRGDDEVQTITASTTGTTASSLTSGNGDGGRSELPVLR